MFLFTDAPVGQRQAGSVAAAAVPVGRGGDAVTAAIREGAERSGAGFEYLLATAKRESALNPSAKAATSSATGLYQFIEQTWLGTMKSAGAKLGLTDQAEAITARADGSFTVADPGARQAILDLRRDPRVSAAMAGELTQRNRETLGSALGREPTDGELYAAHVLGAKGAATLIAAAETSPARVAANDMPEAAAANRALFYDRAGHPRGAADLYAVLTAHRGETRAANATTASAAAPEAATSYAAQEPGLRALFQTDRRQGAVSDGVARLWQGRAAAAPARRDAPSYFPRSDASAETAMESAQERVPDASVPDGAGAPISTPPAATAVPLPPARPRTLGAAAEATRGRAVERSILKVRAGS